MTASENRLLIATANRGKVAEYGELLAGIDCRLLSLADFGISGSVEESGTTYQENATIKAVECAAKSGIVTLADDSGLEVDALGGEPGVFSARYAGDDATDGERVAYLLSKLEDVPEAERGAHFVCVIAIAFPDGDIMYFHGECPGRIVTEPRGDRGFGYDPAFFVPELGRTMAELPPEVKHEISHRGRAAAKARRVLGELIDAGRLR